ncbi:MAG TPA: spore germination protein [Clostridiales bacterium]|nr:MAG: spore gernimation protein [Clostridiales bacterium GWD2_32_59]HAN09567.1 spore germination protein [Clostridiales bacterium]
MKFLENITLKKKKVDEPVSVKNISKNIDENVTKIKNELGDASDLFINFSKTNDNEGLGYVMIYINTMVDSNIMSDLSIELKEILKLKPNISKPEDYGDTLFDYFSGFRSCSQGSEIADVCNELISGSVVIFVEGCSKFLSIKMKAVQARAIEEPTSQTIIRGPKEGFTERIDINIGLIRKKIKSRDLRVENLSVGSVTNTTVSLVYIEGIVKDEILQEIKNRISKIKIDGIFDGGYIEEMIKDDRYSIFPTFMNSEKPDAVAGALLEGRVAILVDGTPYVLTAPALFVEFFQVSEDYYHNFIITSMLRLLRAVALILTLLVPGTFVALITFHQEMIPTALLISIAAQREGIPFPALIEALLMETTFELLREAGIRMPKAIGPAMGIIGALVLGQAAVEAGIISSVMVIIVAITAIAGFGIPSYEMSNTIRLIRFALMFMAGMLGLYGVFMGLIVLVLHVCKLKSIGVPYLTPVAPKINGGNKDTIFRFPFWSMKYRPAGISGTSAARVDGDETVTPSQKEKQEFR